MAKKAIILPADVFDTYEFLCEVFGGVGGGWYWAGPQEPLCVSGFRYFLANENSFGQESWGRPYDLLEYGISSTENDEAVEAINRRKGSPNIHARVSWAEYCEELNIVRGE